MRCSRRRFLWAIPCSLAAHAQEPTNPPPAADLQFFSGLVDDFTGASISVSRQLASRKHELRTFVRTSETVISGSLKKGAKVTVGFTVVDGSHVAHRVIIRS